MEELATIGGLLLAFLIRIGIPIGLTMLLSWLLKRLDARWRNEAMNSKAEAITRDDQDLYFMIWSHNPCWENKQCDPEDRLRCKAFLQSEKPCWEVYRNNGSFNRSCESCEYREKILISLDQYE